MAAQQARSSEADPRSRFRVLGSDAKTQLAGFFSILIAEGRYS